MDNMGVRRERTTGKWYFRTVIYFADGTKERVYGTPGIPGPFQALQNTENDAHVAEKRCIGERSSTFGKKSKKFFPRILHRVASEDELAFKVEEHLKKMQEILPGLTLENAVRSLILKGLTK